MTSEPKITHKNDVKHNMRSIGRREYLMTQERYHTIAKKYQNLCHTTNEIAENFQTTNETVYVYIHSYVLIVTAQIRTTDRHIVFYK